jgi:hypothetical protein
VECGGTPALEGQSRIDRPADLRLQFSFRLSSDGREQLVGFRS